MGKIASKRIESIDLLRGVVMVIMALDHVRDYFHLNAFTANDPTNLETTTPILFFTRFITHYCAPVFIFLAGTSAYLYGSKRKKNTLAKFLLSRGLWLIVVEIVIMNFIWWFDPAYGFINLQVIWAIGLAMVILSLLIYLPPKAILILGLILVFGHNLLDNINFEGQGLLAVLWYILHQGGGIFTENRFILFMYPILPWIGVMSLGYIFGILYKPDFPVNRRKNLLLWLGAGCLMLFLILRIPNLYGDPQPWVGQETTAYTILSFLNVTKYPPSLVFLLVTLGPAFLFLYVTENIKNLATGFFLVFGRVPFFYYVLHILVIHLAAMLGLVITGGDWKIMILSGNIIASGQLDGYGYSLWIVYLVWIIIVILLYFPSKWYMRYKLQNRDKWWLSYL